MLSQNDVKVVDDNLDQRTNLKFLVKLNKSPTESYQMLRDAYGEECMSRALRFFSFPQGKVCAEGDALRIGRAREGESEAAPAESNRRKPTKLFFSVEKPNAEVCSGRRRVHRR